MTDIINEEENTTPLPEEEQETVVVDNGQTYESTESAIIAKEEADRAKLWAQESERQANLASGSADTAAQARDDAVDAKEYAEAAATDANVVAVGTDLRATPSNIKTVASNISDVVTVSGISSDVTAVAGNATDISAVAANNTNITAVANNATNINAVNANKTNIDKVAGDINRVNLVADDIASVHTVAVDISTVIDVANNKTNIDAVAGNSSNINTNATNISAINTNASNITAIQNAYSNATNAQNSANKAQQWAVSENIVDNTDYSAKHYAEIASQHENPLRIGQIIESTIPLTDAGLHLLDGSLIQGDGIYSEFVDYMVQKSKKFNPTPFNLNQHTTVNSEGITSELTYNTRCTVNINNITPTNKIIFNFSGKLQSPIFTYVRLSNTISIYHTGAGNTLVIAYNYNPILSITKNEIPTYNSNFTDIKIELTTTKIIATIKNNGNTFTKEADINITFSQISVLNIPGNDGKVIANLKNCSLIIDNTKIFSGSTQQDYFTDETSWQNSVNTYGVCGKFVLNELNRTIRLPLISGFIEGTNSLSDLGALTAAGLPIPNISIPTTGSGDNNGQWHRSDLMSGGGSLTRGGRDNDNWVIQTLNANNSIIYGNSSTVQPQSIKVLRYICIATSTKTDIQVDIDEIVTDLNGKADKSSFQVVSALPANPDSNTFYFIPE